MTSVAWQAAQGELRVLAVLGRRFAATSRIDAALAPHGRFAVASCATPDDARARLGAEPWDCVVADRREAVPALRREAPDVPVILLGDPGSTAEDGAGGDGSAEERAEPGVPRSA
ncbi:MAG TPA: hypothetical protein VN213_10550, partial [Solirubrobacteraceae bacterium]|nr:hypothetical protein [Solirubrobacteraceae bacterium]